MRKNIGLVLHNDGSEGWYVFQPQLVELTGVTYVRAIGLNANLRESERSDWEEIVNTKCLCRKHIAVDLKKKTVRGLANR